MRQYRPALVVGRHDGSESPSVVWVLMITSAAHRRWAGDVEIADVASAGLPVASIVRTAKIATIEIFDAARIGCLTGAVCAEIRSRVWSILGNSLHTPATVQRN